MIAPSSSVRIRQSLRTVLFVLFAALLLPVTAKGPKGIEVSRYARVAVLVCRMANPSGLLSPITPETDYGVQAPDKKRDVCGEDESRLKQAFPAFPLRSSTHVPKIENEFFGTLTQPLTQTVAAYLKEKGRAVADVRSLPGPWPKPLDQMTVADIVAALSGQADALLVMHYMDQGNAVYDSVKVRRVDRGFSGFQGKLALFEIPGAKPAGEGDVFINPMALLANDPALSATPAWKAKMKVLDHASKDTEFQRGFSMTERQGLLFSSSTVTTFDATDAEMIDLSMHYLVEGLRDPNRIIDVDGLKDLLH